MPLFPLPAKLVRLVVLSLFVLAAVAFFLLQSETSSSWTPAFLSTAPAAPPRNLTSRLDDLLHRPVKSAEVWRTTNALACPKDTYEREPSFMHQGHFRESWDRVGEVEVRKMRSDLVRYMEEIESNGQLEQDLKEEPKRGILMTGGNGGTSWKSFACLQQPNCSGLTFIRHVLQRRSSSSSSYLSYCGTCTTVNYR
jgi:hypothetical protein